MKKYLLLFALIPLSLSSCVKEREEGRGWFSSDRKIQNILVEFDNQSTKCVDSSDDEIFLGESMYVTESGDTVYISAYLSDMDETVSDSDTVETKSVLVGSSNFGTADGYSTFNLDVHKNGEAAIYNSVDIHGTSVPMENVTVSYIGGSTDYKWSFGSTYYWPTDNSSLDFVSYGPSSEFSNTAVISSKSWNKDTKTFSFRYITPSGDEGKEDAENQMDIIAGVNSQAYTKSGPNNLLLSMKHPMMAVRFVLGDIFGKIEYIALKNFFGAGTANITSSGVSWSDLSDLATFTQTYDMFDATAEHDTTGTVFLDTTVVKKRNFIIIPQQLHSTASMDIKLGSTLHPETLSFSKICKDGLTTDWSGYAGKVLTFRIGSKKANLVSVDITDEVNQATMTKHNIRIFNDGKSPIYIRAVLVGNWLNKNNHVLAPWSETNPYGTFTNTTPGADFPSTLPSNWVLNSDGFYYYKKILRSGSQISQNLFDTFTLTSQPKVSDADDPLLVVQSFELDILVQAVAADTTAGTGTTLTDMKKVAKMAISAWNIPDSTVLKLFTNNRE